MHKLKKLALLICVAAFTTACSDKKPSPSAEVKSQQPITAPIQDARFSYAGIYPGATAEQAKNEGFNNCDQKASYEAVLCFKNSPLPDFNNLTVTHAAVQFNKPYETVESIQISAESKRQLPKCKKHKEKSSWDDYEACGKLAPLSAEDIIQIFGKPNSGTIKNPAWTDCDRYTLRFENPGHKLRLSVAKNDSERSLNRSSCERFAKEEARSKSESEKSADFAKSMSKQ